MEAPHRLHEVIPALRSNAALRRAVPRLYCMTFGVLFKVRFPENISSPCIEFQKDRRTPAQRALAA